MKKALAYCFFCSIVLVFSCSEDDKKPARVNLMVNGEPVEVNEVVMSRWVWSNNIIGREELGIFGRINKDRNFILSIVEYGEYSGEGILRGSGLRPKIYLLYGQSEENGENCIYNDSGTYCDYFSFSLPPFDDLYLENVVGSLEITAFDLEEKKVAGTFSVTGNEMNNGPAFSIRGEFNSRFTN